MQRFIFMRKSFGKFNLPGGGYSQLLFTSFQENKKYCAGKDISSIQRSLYKQGDKSMKKIFGIFAMLLMSASVSMADAPKTELIKVKIIMSEFLFQVEGAPEGAPLVLKAGQRYKMIFENHGQILHEVLLGRGLVSNHGEHEYKENMLVDQQVVVTGSSVINEAKRVFAVVTNGFEEFEMDPDLRLSLLFTVPESAKGTWEMGCFAEGHHESGMFLPVIVE